MEELRAHCERQVEECEKWAKYKGIEPSGRIYEEHKLILDLIKALEQQPSDDCVSREQALLQLTGVNLSDKTTEELIGLFGRRIKSLPPVTPTFPKGATNGDMIQAMFPNIEANIIETDTGGYIEVKYLDTTDKCDATAFRKNWWNAPYKRGSENADTI